MEDRKYRLSGEPNIALPISEADRLIASCDGTATLLYLYALRNGGDFSAQKAALALKRTETEIEKAIARLCEMGLFKTGETRSTLPFPSDELPEYTAEDIALRVSENGEFRAVVGETQRILGHMLTGTELKKLFGIYDHLRLPAEVIFLLLNHCVEKTRERTNSKGSMPSMQAIEKEAYVWYNREILTFERAEEYLLRKKERSGVLSEVKNVLQINDRNLGATEREYVEKWLDMGFGLEAIAEAYDRTVVQAGKLKWPYMNSIFMRWHEKNLHTIDEIMKGDGRIKSSRPQTQGGRLPPSGGNPRDDTELLKKLLSQSKNG